MTRKKCRKLIMAAGAQKRDVEEYMDNLLPECGSYERLFISTVTYAVLAAAEEMNNKQQAECYARCCV